MSYKDDLEKYGEWTDCYECDGAGTVHDCGEDCCCCLNPDTDDQVICRECKGKGGWLEIPNWDFLKPEAK